MRIYEDLKLTQCVDSFFSYFGKKMNLNFFSYLRIYNNGEILRFCNNFEWSKKYYSDEFYNQVDFYKSHIELISDKKEEIFLWQTQPKNLIYSSFHDYGIWHGLSVYQRYDNFVETYSVATNPDNKEIYNFYFNYLDEIKNFGKTFKNNFLNHNMKNSKIFSSVLKPHEYNIKSYSKNNI